MDEEQKGKDQLARLRSTPLKLTALSCDLFSLLACALNDKM